MSTTTETPQVRARVQALIAGAWSTQVIHVAARLEVFDRLLDYVRSHGTPVPDDQLTGSDIILPPPDVSLAEAQSEFQGEGLIPG